MRIWMPAVVCVTVLILAAGGLTAAAPAGQEIVVAGEADVVQFDPLQIQELPTSFVAGMIMERLVQRTVDGKITGALAERWKISVDRRTWTFFLRKGVRFHDGSEFDASVVDWHFRRVLDPRAGSLFRAQFSGIEKIEIPDRYTVAITLRQPNVAFLDLVLLTNGGLIPSKAAFDTLGRDFPFKPVGTGPFRFVSWTQGQRVTLERNPNWWGGAVTPSRVIIRPISEANTAVIELETGGVHFIQRASKEDLDRLAKDPKAVVHRVPSYRIRYIVLNSTFGPFQDVRVRQAVNHAINMPQIVNTLAAGMAVPIDAMLPAGTPWMPPTGQYTAYPFDQQKARTLLAEAGWRPGAGRIVQKDGQPFRLALATPNGRYFMDKEISEVVCNQLRQVGIDCAVRVMEWATFLSDARSGKTDAAFLGWNQSSDEPSLFFDALIRSDGRGNYTRGRDATIDNLLTEALIAFSEGRRKLLYNRAVDLANKQAWYIPVATENKVAITTARLQGYRHGAPQTGYEFVNASLK
jgi:peptide/nickel transport system substrate-binding protein